MVEKLSNITMGLQTALLGLMAVAFVFMGAGAAVAQSNPIGEVRELTGSVSIDRAGQAGISVSLGDQVYQNDVITTDDESGVGVTFVDGTNFGLGSNAHMVLDSYAYDGSSGNGLLSVVEGSFAFISGGLSKVGDDALQINTPTMTIGIRGTTGSGRAGPIGTINFITLERDEDGGVGKIMASNKGGKKLLTRVNERTETDDPKKAPVDPYIVSDEEIKKGTGRAIKHLPGKADRNKDKSERVHGQHVDQHMDRHVDDHISRSGEDGVNKAIEDHFSNSSTSFEFEFE